MKRAIVAVLCLLAPTAWGQLNLDYHFTYEGTYTPAGLTTPVGVSTLTESTDVGVLGAIVLDIGADYVGYGGNPFQVGIQQGGTWITTPTVYDANDWLATETFAYHSDSHFMFPPDWQPVVTSPTEKNDGSLGTYVDPYGQTEVRGLGGLRVATAVPVVERVPVMDVVRVGVSGCSPVYLNGQICDGVGHVRYVEAVQFPMLYQNTWQGSGTGGQTATDPNDPTVQWSHPGNWSRGVVPDLSDGVRIEMSNPGLLVATSGSVGSLYVDSSSPETSFQIPDSANVSVTGSLIVGEHSTATAIQSGTAQSLFFSLGENPGAAGSYELTDGRLTVERKAYVGKDGVGAFSQGGGTVQVGGTLALGRFGNAMGTYRLQGGCLAAGSVWMSGHSLFHQTGGSLATERIDVERNSTFLLGEGEVRTPVEEVADTFIQTGGTNIVTDLLSVTWFGGGATYEMRGGALDADRIYVGMAYYSGSNSTFQLAGGEVNATAADLRGDLVQQGGLLNVRQIQLSYNSTCQMHGGEVRTDLLGIGGLFAQDGGRSMPSRSS